MTATLREAVLLQAVDKVRRDHAAAHNGGPEQNFERIASYWSTYLGKDVEPHDVAAMMTLVELTRISSTPQQIEHWIDALAHMARGAEARP